MASVGTTPERRLIDAGAAEIGALFYGDAGNPPVVLLHGWADSAWSMDSIATMLADRYRVISLDLRGHGHSSRGPYNMINLIGDLRGVIEAPRGVTCPVLVANGGDSYERYWKFIQDDPAAFPGPLTGEALQNRLANFADVRYVEIDGAGHMLPYDKPDELNTVIADFLKEVGS